MGGRKSSYATPRVPGYYRGAALGQNISVGDESVRRPRLPMSCLRLLLGAEKVNLSAVLLLKTFMSKSRLLLYAHLALCASSIAAVGTYDSSAKESNKQAAPAEHSTKLDTTNGFRGQKFGTPFSDFQGLTLDKDQGDLKLYVKKDENLQLGPVKLESIIYHFFQDKFFAISLNSQDRDSTLGLLRVAQVAFGQGAERPDAKGDLDKSWLGKAAEAFFTVNPKTEEGSLFIRDNQLGSQVETYWEKLTTDAANDL
jgi:hypothetical protein